MRFIKSGATTIIFKFIAMSASLGVSVLIGRTLGPDGRGTYGLIMTIIVLSTNFGLFGLAGANAYLIGGDRTRSRAIGVHSLAIGLLGAAVAVTTVLVINSTYPSALRGLTPGLLIPTLLLVPIFLWGTLFSYAFLGQGRITAFNIFESVEKLLIVLLGIVCLVIAGAGLETFMVCSAASVAVFLGLYISSYFIKSPAGPLYEFRILPSALSYGIRAYVATILTYAVLRSGIFFVNSWLGTAQAGLYATAQQLAELLVIMPGIIGTVLFSRIAGGARSALTARVVRTAAVMMLPIFAILAAARKLIIVLLFGIEFAPAADIFLIFLPGTYLLGLEVIIASEFAGCGYPWPAALAWLPVLIINVTGYALLIPRLGVAGAAISTTFSFLILFAYILLYYRQQSGQNLRRILILQREDIMILAEVARSLPFINRHFKKARTHAAQAVSDKGQAEIERTGVQV